MRIAVIGAGAIGATHCQFIRQTPPFDLVAIADPAETARNTADAFGAKWFPNHTALLDASPIEGAIIAAPNELHRTIALDCLRAGVPVLIEKPLAPTVSEAMDIATASEQSGVAVLVGHHRRHNPLVKRAKAMIDGGDLGRLVTANICYSMMKPDDYFRQVWRMSEGSGGPLLINAIHEVDLLRHLIGEVDSVAAFSSSTVRHFRVEDTAAVLFRFSNGALAALTVSDTASSPWSWDLTSGEVDRFPKHAVASHRLVGTHGALTLPEVDYWTHAGERSWTTRMTARRIEVEPANPFVEQLRHFREVAAGMAIPLVGATEGTRNIAVMEAITRACASERTEAVVFPDREAAAAAKLPLVGN